MRQNFVDHLTLYTSYIIIQTIDILFILICIVTDKSINQIVTLLLGFELK